MPGGARHWAGREGEDLREASWIPFVPGNWYDPDLVAQLLGAEPGATLPHPHPSFSPRRPSASRTCHGSLLVAPRGGAVPNVSPGLCQLGRGVQRASGQPFEPARHRPSPRPRALRSRLVEEDAPKHPWGTQAFSLTRHTSTQTHSATHTDPKHARPCSPARTPGRARMHLWGYRFQSLWRWHSHPLFPPPPQEHPSRNTLPPAVRCPSLTLPFSTPPAMPPSLPYGGDQIRHWKRWGSMRVQWG